MESAAAQAKWASLHDERPWHDGTFTRWAQHQTDGTPYHFSHGVTIGVGPIDRDPDDRFLTAEECGPPSTEATTPAP